jgi:hypothetical protein
MIKCGNCGRMLEDTFQEHIICRYCGKKTNREEALSNSEEEIRRRVIWDISDNIRKYKLMRNVGFGIGPVLLFIAFLFLFSNVFTLYIQLIFVATLGLGCAWLFVGYIASRNLEGGMGKMFDLSADTAD